VKILSKNQLTGQRGESLVADRTLAMGFAFDGRNRLETGIDGFIELRDPKTGQTLAKWIGTQVKTTDGGNYVREDAASFEYLLKPDDLAYWRQANIPVIIVLVRLSDSTMYWKSVDAGNISEPRRLTFNKSTDQFDKGSTDQIAALCVDRDRIGSYVPPMQTGEPVHLTMVRVVLPEEIFVGTSLFASGRQAARELSNANLNAPFDWVIRDRRFLSLRDPSDSALTEIVDEGSIEAVDTESVAFPDDVDEEYIFIDLLARTLSVQLDHDLNFDRDSRALYFRALGPNQSRHYRYQSLVNETSAEVVKPYKGRDKHVLNVRHHAFIPRFQRIGDEWFLSVTPTFIFTRDGYRPHYNPGALIAGKKKLEKNGAVRGQFVMWRHLLTQSGQVKRDLLSEGTELVPLLKFEPLDAIIMPLAVPEEAWRRDDPNAVNMIDTEALL
jgi:hypothetical protein